ncbi:hypothetical protein I4U23_008919 [Adineta vaga]|nr:hypothetical protein I4U23_008919 [Adineta vaga]
MKTNSSLSLQEKQNKFHRHVNIQMFSVREANSRKNLRIQYRFVQGILYLVGAYLFAWTTDLIIALLQMFHAQFINQHQFFITLSAFIAKLSVILSPLVYLSIMKFRLFKQLLFQK